MIGVLSACGADDSEMRLELRNHAGATYDFLISDVQFPELSDYDVISLTSYSARVDDDKMKPVVISIPQGFKGVERLSSVSFYVTVSSVAGDDSPRGFPITMAVDGDGTPWLDYVVRDGDFSLSQGRD